MTVGYLSDRSKDRRLGGEWQAKFGRPRALRPEIRSENRGEFDRLAALPRPSSSLVASHAAAAPGAPATETYDEQSCVERACEGDMAAFELIFLRYERKIYAFTLRMMGNPEDAGDVTQECFIRAYNGLPRITRELNVSAWLHRIASNLCLDMLRRKRRISWLPWEPHKHEPLLGSPMLDDPERRALGSETQALVQQVLSEMSARNRLALVLREYEGMSCDDIAQVLGTSVGAAKSTLFRAREEFRRHYRAAAGR